jgi:hypothetical protein
LLMFFLIPLAFGSIAIFMILILSIHEDG